MKKETIQEVELNSEVNFDFTLAFLATFAALLPNESEMMDWAFNSQNIFFCFFERAKKIQISLIDPGSFEVGFNELWHQPETLDTS